MELLGSILFGGATAGVGIASAIMQYRDGKAQASAERAMLRNQASMYSQQANMLLRGAKMQAKAAGISKQLGQTNARMVRSAGTSVYHEAMYDISAANRERRQKIGMARTNFASRGVLVDSGAAGQWERDELADAILEKAQILRTCADRGLNVESEAVGAIVSGLHEAAQGYAGAASSAANAWSSFVQGHMAMNKANATKDPSKTALGLSVAGSIMQGVASGASMYSPSSSSGGSRSSSGSASSASAGA